MCPSNKLCCVVCLISLLIQQLLNHLKIRDVIHSDPARKDLTNMKQESVLKVSHVYTTKVLSTSQILRPIHSAQDRGVVVPHSLDSTGVCFAVSLS